MPVAARAMMPTMPRIWRGMTGAVALGLVVLCSGSISATLPQGQVFPAAEWARHTDPASAGYCQPGLDAATTRAKGMATTQDPAGWRISFARAISGAGRCAHCREVQVAVNGPVERRT